MVLDVQCRALMRWLFIAVFIIQHGDNNFNHGLSKAFVPLNFEAVMQCCAMFDSGRQWETMEAQALYPGLAIRKGGGRWLETMEAQAINPGYEGGT
jgi:hypothetical protein